MEIIREMLIPEANDLGSWMLCILFWILGLLLVALILLGLYALINFAFVPISEGQGTVSELYYRPAYTTTNLIHVGKSLIPMTQYHSETWNIAVMFEGVNHETTLDEEFYRTFKRGETVGFTYFRGRINTDIWLHSVFHLKP